MIYHILLTFLLFCVIVIYSMLFIQVLYMLHHATLLLFRFAQAKHTVYSGLVGRKVAIASNGGSDSRSILVWSCMQRAQNCILSGKPTFFSWSKPVWRCPKRKSRYPLIGRVATSHMTMMIYHDLSWFMDWRGSCSQTVGISSDPWAFGYAKIT